jgi:hypothetical protein
MTNGRRFSLPAPVFFFVLAALGAATACDDHHGCHHAPKVDAGPADALAVQVGDGSASVQGSFNNCPTVRAAASPPAAPVGGTIDVMATLADMDPADRLSVAWSAPSGSFANATLAHTTYTCATAGEQTLTARASDGRCEESATVTVSCEAP